MIHDRMTFTAEYCRVRHIPYKIKREALFIDGKQICFSLYNLTFVNILDLIDSVCIYDPLTLYYASPAKKVRTI